MVFKKIIKYLLIVTTLVVIAFIGNNIYTRIKLNKLNYTKTSIKTIMKHNLEKEIYKIGKNQTLNTVLQSKDFNKNNFKLYSKIKYKKLSDLTNSINKLNNKKYNINQINLIIKSSNDGDVNKFLKNKYEDDFDEYLKFDYSKLSNLERYINYSFDKKASYEESVVQVNIGLDKEFYENANVVTKYSDNVLMNKYNKLSEKFIPKSLTLVSEDYTEHEETYLAEVAYDNFKKMADAAKSEKLSLVVNSGYRDYKAQDEIYKLYEKSYGSKYAKNYAALPGFSEHQTGLAIDVGARGAKLFANTEEFKWIRKNAYKYGFILRYQKDKANITGYNYEAWHYRYVGNDIAKYIYENDLTYDEYYIMFLES